MKKAFAVMSTLMLALACFGLFSKTTVAAAEDKTFVVDPTLAEDEDPMYIMDSIYSTFPHYYRMDEKFDEAWQGESRMYPWNETRLRVKQYDLATGQPTGRYYAVYFTGALKHMENNEKVYGAGKNVLFYTLDDSGAVRLSKRELSTWYHNRNAGDPSLSHMNSNATGQDITFDMVEVFAKVGDGADSGRMMNQSLVFDGQGRVIRGSVGNAVFLEPGTDGAAEYLMPAVFCYVDGKVVKYVAGETTPDKKQEPQLDEEGNVVMDDEGNPVMVPTDKDHMLYKRFTWAWFAEKPENVNEVGYLEEGWDPHKWDYCFEQDGGYMCYAFMGTDGSEELLDAEALAFYNEQLKAAHIAEEKPEEEFKPVSQVSRKVITEFYIPAGGWTYDFGYLDKGTDLLADFQQMFLAGYYYGREAGYAEQRTYNFSSSGLLTEEKVIDGNSYRLLENNVIEVMPGTVVNPSKNIIYTGLSQYWDKGEDGTENKLDGFVSDTTICEFYIKVNGVTAVMPAKYPSWDKLVEDFMADINAFVRAKKGEAYVDVVLPAAISTSDRFYTEFNNELGTTSATYASFLQDEAMWAKWSWIFEYINQQAGGGQLNANKTVASPGNWTYTVWGLLTKSPAQGGWPSIKADSTNAEADLLQVVKWADYTFTASEELDTRYVVEYTVKNTVTGNESSTTITYVVTDVYTPVIELNAAALNVKSEKKDGKVVINDGQPITAAQLLTAYNGKYANITNDVKRDIKGTDITYKVVLDSETLDFSKPTEGRHSVVAKVVAQSATTYKEELVRFTVVIRDRTNPVVTTVNGTLNVAYGSVFDPQMGIVAASDNVDGNLKLAAHTWCIDLSETPVNTLKPGTYTVKLGIYDGAGNATNVSYVVKVAEAYANEDGIKDLSGLVEDNAILLEELQEVINGILAKVDKLSQKGCGKSSAALAVQILSASSLLVLVLRKKH